MKRFSLAWLILFVALCALALALAVSQLQNRRMRLKVAELTNGLNSQKRVVESLDLELVHARLGTSFLHQLARRPGFDDLLTFIDTIPPDSLACYVSEIDEYPTIKIYDYFSYNNWPDREPTPHADLKRVKIIVDADSLNVVDYIMRDGGVMNTMKVNGGSWNTRSQLPDGTPVEYEITPSGFIRIH